VGRVGVNHAHTEREHSLGARRVVVYTLKK
jgi:hypothetical protein